MKQRTFLLKSLIVIVALQMLSPSLFGWGKEHDWLNEWAAARLPKWQIKYFGAKNLKAFAHKYGHIQDSYASRKFPGLDKYCVVPGLKFSLHDVNSPAVTLKGVEFYLTKTCELLRKGEKDEAMKFLGVLCHWCEDPGSIGAHSNPVNERTLRAMIPPPPKFQGRHYLTARHGLGISAGMKKKAVLTDKSYKPKLLGGTIPQAAAAITCYQKKMETRAGSKLARAIIAKVDGEKEKLNAIVSDALDYNARFISDIVYTVGCLAADKFDKKELENSKKLPLTNWAPVKALPKVYCNIPFIVNQCMDVKRKLYPIELPGSKKKVEFGLGMEPAASVSYVLGTGGVYNEFSSKIGVHSSAGPDQKVVFIVKINGKEAFRSKPLSSKDAPEDVKMNLPDAPVVRLDLETKNATEKGPKVPLHNIAVWAEPVLRLAAE